MIRWFMRLLADGGSGFYPAARYDIGHGYSDMTFVVDALSVEYEQDLRGFVFYKEGFRYFV